MRVYLGVDLGASSFKYGVGDSKEGLQCFDTIPIGERSIKGLQDIVKEILKRCEKWEISAIGIGTPGTIRRRDGKLIGINPNLQCLRDISPKELFPGELKLPIYFDNDANLMVFAESALEDTAVCAGITVGSGIGGGLVINKRIFHGAHGYAAEFGHTKVNLDDSLCGCGQRGCLEAYASVEGIRRQLKKRESPFSGLGLPNLISLRYRDKVVQEVIDMGEKALSIALAGVVSSLDPDVFVMGGGAMDLGLYNIKDLAKMIEQQIPVALVGQCKYKLARYGNRAGVMGAIMLCEQGS